MEKKKQQLHVVMVPWLAYGHINPYLELAKKLDSHGLKISFVSTPVNISRIKDQILPAGVDLVELPLPLVEGLPNGVESTADLKHGGTFELLIDAMDGWQMPFEALLRRLSPDFVIHDMTQYWAPPIAAKLGIPTILFSLTAAASISFLLAQENVGLDKSRTVEDLTVSPPGFPSSLIHHPVFEARKLLSSVYDLKKQERMSMAERWRMCVEGSWAIACNTCLELEGKYLLYLQTITCRPVVPVGILMPHLPPWPAHDHCLSWLDRQAARSVVLVSFGSESTLNSQELSALALGLEECQIPFLLLLHGEVAAELPQGFGGRTKGRGLLVTQWAPQLHILSHSSMGAFLSHCGWNSVTEGLRFEVPLVALPMQHDQGINAKLIVEELKLGVEVRRNEQDGSFTKEDICKAVRTVMVAEAGRKIRSNVADISRALTSNNCQVYAKNVDNFVSLLKEKVSYKEV